MDRSQWLKELKQQLNRSGLPLGYVKRSLLEIDDHLMEAHQNSTTDLATDGLGVSPDELANQFRESFCKSKWYRRVPTLCWFLIPIPVCWITCLLFYIPSLLLVEFSCSWPGMAPDWSIGAMQLEWLFYTGKVVTPVIAAFLLVKIFEQVAAPRWVWIGSFVMLCIGFMITLTAVTLPTATSPPSFTIMTEPENGFADSVIAWKTASDIFRFCNCNESNGQ